MNLCRKCNAKASKREVKKILLINTISIKILKKYPNPLRIAIRRHLVNISGWRTGRKIVVIESDDWGGIRMKSTNAYDDLSKKIGINKTHYNRIDCLETDSDLEKLYNCLFSFKDVHGNHPKITANFVLTNPDFDKIKESNFEAYYYENIIQSYNRYYQSNKPFELVKEGITNKIFLPQFHGREHIQVEYWMRDLKASKKETREAFNYSFFGFGKNDLDGHGYLSAFSAISKKELEFVKKRIKEGLDFFENLFGYKSRSIIAPQNTMHYELLPLLKEEGVDVIQGSRINKQHKINKGDKTQCKRLMGEINHLGQINVVRNATFEPSAGKINWVEKCIKEIEGAFFWNKPAVICSHRANYMGFLEENNRDNGLNQLRLLLQKIQKKWPDVEFLSTVELADTIKSNA